MLLHCVIKLHLPLPWLPTCCGLRFFQEHYNAFVCVSFTKRYSDSKTGWSSRSWSSTKLRNYTLKSHRSPVRPWPAKSSPAIQWVFLYLDISSNYGIKVGYRPSLGAITFSAAANCTFHLACNEIMKLCPLSTHGHGQADCWTDTQVLNQRMVPSI